MGYCFQRNIGREFFIRIQGVQMKQPTLILLSGVITPTEIRISQAEQFVVQNNIAAVQNDTFGVGQCYADQDVYNEWKCAMPSFLLSYGYITEDTLVIGNVLNHALLTLYYGLDVQSCIDGTFWKTFGTSDFSSFCQTFYGRVINDFFT